MNPTLCLVSCHERWPKQDRFITFRLYVWLHCIFSA